MKPRVCSLVVSVHGTPCVLEKGYCLHGNDIDAEHTPVEAGLNWTVGWKTDFRGKAALVDQKEQGPSRKLVGSS